MNLRPLVHRSETPGALLESAEEGSDLHKHRSQTPQPLRSEAVASGTLTEYFGNKCGIAAHLDGRPECQPRRRRTRGLAPSAILVADGFDVVCHREDSDGPERERDRLRSAGPRRRNRPLNCGDARPRGMHAPERCCGPCESKRAHSEPSCQRAPTVTNDCIPPPWHRTTEQ